MDWNSGLLDSRNTLALDMCLEYPSLLDCASLIDPVKRVQIFSVRGFFAKRCVSKTALKGLHLPSRLEVCIIIISPTYSMISFPRTFNKTVHQIPRSCNAHSSVSNVPSDELPAR